MNRLLPGRAFLSLVGAVLGLWIMTTPAAAATPAGPEVSSNWAGYAVNSRAAGSQLKFKRVSGTWVQPTPKCNAAGATYSAFWVGLGGFHSHRGLEQIGTEADCSAAGSIIYMGWYELIPAAPRELKLAIRPGDVVSASVAVRAGRASLSLTDQSTGESFVKHVRVPYLDTSSAEWIVEAPSACDHLGNCATLPLANFGTVTFSSASTTAQGHTGPISDPAWTATPIELRHRARDFRGPQFATSVTPANAVPAALASTGATFSVNWQEQNGPAGAPAAPALPGAGER